MEVEWVLRERGSGELRQAAGVAAAVSVSPFRWHRKLKGSCSATVLSPRLLPLPVTASANAQGTGMRGRGRAAGAETMAL
jgi:hypothetical protein